MAVTYQVPEYQPPTDNELYEKALAHSREMNKPTGKKYINLKVEAAKRYAESLISQGVDPEMAWNRAIRAEILDHESD